MRIETFEALLSPRGQRLIDEVTARAGHESDLALGTRLRRTYDPDLVAAAVTQAHLRGNARAKFGDDASRMYFTHDALEQATRGPVAGHRARRAAATGAGTLHDLGCGIGGDLITFARAGLAVRGVEADPVRAAIARANLQALGLDGVVRVADATTIERGADDLTFVDPARRDGNRRVFEPEDFVPSWSFASGLLAGRGIVKTMPGIDHNLVPEGAEAEWVSHHGTLVEACLWGRPLATARRRATVLSPRGGGDDTSVTDEDDPGDRTSGPVGGYLYEPDDAVIRAGLVTAVAARVDGRLLDPHIAYVTSGRLVETPLARAFRVVAEVPFREKPLKAALRGRDVGALTVKKRGVQVVPDDLVRRLALRGHVPATVLMTRVDGAGRAYLVEPVPPRWP